MERTEDELKTAEDTNLLDYEDRFDCNQISVTKLLYVVIQVFNFINKCSGVQKKNHLFFMEPMSQQWSINTASSYRVIVVQHHLTRQQGWVKAKVPAASSVCCFIAAPFIFPLTQLCAVCHLLCWRML